MLRRWHYRSWLVVSATTVGNNKTECVGEGVSHNRSHHTTTSAPHLLSDVAPANDVIKDTTPIANVETGRIVTRPHRQWAAHFRLPPILISFRPIKRHSLYSLLAPLLPLDHLLFLLISFPYCTTSFIQNLLPSVGPLTKTVFFSSYTNFAFKLGVNTYKLKNSNQPITQSVC